MTPALKRAACPVVIDHMGRIDASLGLDQQPFRDLLALMANQERLGEGERMPTASRAPGRLTPTPFRSRADWWPSSATACCGAPTGRIPITRTSPTTACWWISSGRDRAERGRAAGAAGRQSAALLSFRAGAQTARSTGMSGRLQDKIAIVTGAGCVGPGWGNGRATCVRFAEEGAKIFAVDRDLASVAETVERVQGRGRRDRRTAMRRHRLGLGRRHGGGVPQTLRPHRRAGQQCRRLGRRRPGRDGGRGVGRPGRLQPQERVPHLQARAAGDGEAGQRRRSSTPPRPPACAGPARRRSATPPPRPASSSSRAWWPCNMPPRASA